MTFIKHHILARFGYKYLHQNKYCIIILLLLLFVCGVYNIHRYIYQTLNVTCLLEMVYILSNVYGTTYNIIVYDTNKCVYEILYGAPFYFSLLFYFFNKIAVAAVLFGPRVTQSQSVLYL